MLTVLVSVRKAARIMRSPFSLISRREGGGGRRRDVTNSLCLAVWQSPTIDGEFHKSMPIFVALCYTIQ